MESNKKPTELWNVGERRFVELHGTSRPIVRVRVTECVGSSTAPEVTHYGWEWSDKPGRVSMIYPRVYASHLRPEMFVQMCMPEGIEAAVARGRGKLVCLNIVESVSDA